MGRRKAGFRKNHFFKHQRNQAPVTRETKETRKPYNAIIRENEKFITYYKTQNVCKKDEFDDFINHMKTDLPSTFRITGSKEVARKMLELVEEKLIKDCISQEEADRSPNIYPLSWYPNKLAWQLELTRKDIRRLEAYYKLHNFLISETEHGTISRQETVSMIPPLLLDVQPEHKVLDMCAAPGSKTAQLLEMLHQNDDPIPPGFVIANDVDNKRCYMLVHQAKRLNSPCVAIINHDSASLPNMFETLPDGSSRQIQFDRILCDVPCSGDGTMRKNPDIWMKWTPANALNLHGIQYRILRRGAELLSVGGRIVYSTCSLNPIENESVIHRILVEANGSLELVDVCNALPGLKYTPGMEDWLVSSRNLEFYKSFDEVDEKWRTTIRPQMFPPAVTNREKYHLNRCLRILPHQQNTGAFFVAVLRKVKPFTSNEKAIKDEEAEETKKRENEDSRLPQNQRKRRRRDGYREDRPFVFFDDDEPVWTDIKKFYEISDQFESKCLLTRCPVGKKKNIYLTSEGVRDLVVANQGRLKFINTGVKAFVRCDNKNMKCPFRIANDGLESIYPYVGKSRKVDIPRDDLITLLMNDKPQKSPPITSLSRTVQDQVRDLSPGSCILIYKENMKDSNIPLIIHVSGWRGTTSLRCYMTQHSTVHLLRLLGGDISKYDVNKFKKADDEGLKSVGSDDTTSKYDEEAKVIASE
ncbi:LOW QUALITY PROTEIN: tRNA (cytosine(34)-C(5))-methyltransferase [Cylas formicarius]|uniref:LOW QUALITY PROTEIN: tRNA (cytosine(34)-C(5))-methyltransferase n=1 Tax=Cylas formicarius TaxID=197179 RepID=UPI002958AECA|nr:LOW QUALITY PROTEIN: tRNA (cytosine(34)-C(5))-methyltransferase [Cylas formicarius]